MLLNVESVLKNIGKSVKLSERRAVAGFDFDKRHIAFTAPVSVTGTLVYDGEKLTFDGRLTAETATACDRCAAQTPVVIEAEFSEVFSKEAEEGYELAGQEIDVDRMVADIVAMEYPAKVVCGSPGCGFDDIIEPPEQKDNPFYILKQRQRNDEEV